MHFQLKPESEHTNQGYLYLMEKSELNFFLQHRLMCDKSYFSNYHLTEAFTATWQKYYCTYKKQNKQFTMLQYNQQIPGRIVSYLFIFLTPNRDFFILNLILSFHLIVIIKK